MVAARCIPRRDHEFDDGFVQGLMVRVCQDDLDLVRSYGKTDEDEGLAAGISPVPRRIIHDDMDVPDAGRHIEGIWAVTELWHLGAIKCLQHGIDLSWGK